MAKAIAEMRSGGGYDVVIVCTSNQSLEDFWQNRLELGKPQVRSGSYRSCVPLPRHMAYTGALRVIATALMIAFRHAVSSSCHMRADLHPSSVRSPLK